MKRYMGLTLSNKYSNVFYQYTALYVNSGNAYKLQLEDSKI